MDCKKKEQQQPQSMAFYFVFFLFSLGYANICPHEQYLSDLNECIECPKGFYCPGDNEKHACPPNLCCPPKSLSPEICDPLKACFLKEEPQLSSSFLSASSCRNGGCEVSNYGPQCANFETPEICSGGGWSARQNSLDQWIAIEMSEIKDVTRIKVAGSSLNGEHVTKFSLVYGNNGKTWNDFGVYSNAQGVFDIPVYFQARFVALVPQEWNVWITMRLEIYSARFYCPEKGISFKGQSCSADTECKTYKTQEDTQLKELKENASSWKWYSEFQQFGAELLMSVRYDYLKQVREALDMQLFSIKSLLQNRVADLEKIKGEKGLEIEIQSIIDKINQDIAHVEREYSSWPPSHRFPKAPNPDSTDIDAVILWANGTTDAYSNSVKMFSGAALYNTLSKTDKEKFTEEFPEKVMTDDVVGSYRHRSNGELVYLLRSLEMHMPWLRHIYIITGGHIPLWLNHSNPRVSMVFHEDVFTGQYKKCLPVFNSQAIYTQIHKIPGIAPRFLLFNDDFFVGRPVEKSFFVDGLSNPNRNHMVMTEKVEAPGPKTHAFNKYWIKYIASIWNSMKMLDDKFGYERRYLPAHSPLFVHKSMVEEMELMWREEWVETACQRLRSNRAFDFFTLYMYYLKNSKGVKFNPHIFNPSKHLYYIELTGQDMDAIWLKKLKNSTPTYFCINDNLPEEGTEIYKKTWDKANEVLNYLYPQKSSFEMSDGPFTIN